MAQSHSYADRILIILEFRYPLWPMAFIYSAGQSKARLSKHRLRAS
jgi:hypothetical protein